MGSGTQSPFQNPRPVAPPAPKPAAQRGLFPKSKIDEAFLEFHQANPKVYKKLVYFARRCSYAGFKSFGMAAIFERMRWHYAIERKKGEAFKLNNNFRAPYARLIMEQEKDLREFFETRRRRSE